MSLELHMHPLSSYCWKVLIALYERGTPFEAVTVNLGDPTERAAYFKLSPFGKIPALQLAAPLDGFPVTAAYRARLLERPSVARAISEAKPFFPMFPGTAEERARMPA